MNSTFRLPCFRELVSELGVSDAACELTELAIRQLESDAHASGDIRQFVEGLSKTHGVVVTVNEDLRLFNLTRRSYIVLAYSFFDQFLSKLRGELELITGEPWGAKNDEENQVEYVLRQLNHQKASLQPFAGAYWFELVEFYRLTRNQIVHPKADYSDRLGRLRTQINKTRSLGDDRYAKLKGPNTPDSLQFDDFVLCSRLVKDIAEGICSIARPKPEQFVKLRLKDKFPALKENPVRLRNQIQGFLCTEYSLAPEEAATIAVECMAG
jgi:hypothetical protein